MKTQISGEVDSEMSKHLIKTKVSGMTDPGNIVFHEFPPMVAASSRGAHPLRVAR